MSKYNTFLTVFIISIASCIIFFVCYIQGIGHLIGHSQEYINDTLQHDPMLILKEIFTPAVILSFIIMIISVLTSKILGIVYVAKNKTIESGEKALWIIGFVVIGFITSIVFLVLAKNKHMVD